MSIISPCLFTNCHSSLKILLPNVSVANIYIQLQYLHQWYNNNQSLHNDMFIIIVTYMYMIHVVYLPLTKHHNYTKLQIVRIKSCYIKRDLKSGVLVSCITQRRRNMEMIGGGGHTAIQV